MAADVAEFLWNKSLNALREAETELFFQFTLASHFKGIKQVLESQNKKNICSSSTSSICELLYELNDILTECRIFAQQRKLFKKNWIHFNPFTDSRFVHKRKKRLGSVKERFHKMVEEWEGKYSECNTPKILDCGKICERTSTPGISDGSSIIGFQSCVQDIESKLCNGGFKIIGISGMCGTGKTTLAREIFNGESVSTAFSTKIWVCLSGIKSNEPNIGIQIFKLVLNELDYNIDELMMDKLDMVELLGTLHLLISHEKYLIVFDDVWPWHANFLAAEINSAGGLPRGSGGAVIVTSRLKKVARRIGGENMIDLQPPLLEGEDCGKIVEDTLGGIDTSKGFDDAKWNKIKYEIRYQSHGLPIAAKVLGGIFLDKIRNPQHSSGIS